MASGAIQTLLGTNAAPKVAALTGLGTLALFVELPELFAFVGLLIYVVACRKQASAPEWCEAVANHRIFDPLRPRSSIWFVIALILAVLTDMLVQFTIALLSAVSYIALYEYGQRNYSASSKARQGDGKGVPMPDDPAFPQCRRRDVVGKSTAGMAKASASCVVDEVRAPRAGLDGEIQELVRCNTATREDDAVTRHLVRLARKCILPVVPEADIRAIPCGNLSCIGEANSKPEVDMIVTVEPSQLAERLKAYFLKGKTRIQKRLETLHPDVLQKTATKCLSQRLTFVRFWRSQYVGPEPLIVLLVPVEMQIFSHPIRLNFSVNTPYRLRIPSVLTNDNGHSKELALLVVHWARERCIANISKGQPHPYAWTLFAIYFIRNQVANNEVNKTTAELFKDFVAFYASWLDRRDDPVSVCFSKTVAQPSAEGALWGVPYIEDPFDSANHVGAFMNADGVTRMKEELARARTILERDEGAKLAELVERWTPPISSE